MHLISWLGTATKLSSRTFLDPKDRVVEWKLVLREQTRRNKRPSHCVCLVQYKQISGMSHVKEHSSALHTVYASFYKQISGMSHVKEHSSALHTVYASFYKQRSGVSHVKEHSSALHTVYASFCKQIRREPREGTFKRAAHCVCLVL